MFKRYPFILLPARNGMLGAVLGMALALTLFFIGKHPMVIPIYMDYRLILFGVLLVFTLKEYRDYYNKGLLSFFEGMGLSIVFTVAFSIITGAVIFAIGSLKPAFVTEYVALYSQQFRNAPPEQIEKIGKDNFEKMLVLLKETRAGDLALQYVIQSFTISFFVSLIISVILRRQPKY